MSRNKSLVVLSRLLLHCRSCRLLPSPAVYHHHCATSLQHLTEKVRGRFFSRHIMPRHTPLRNRATTTASAAAAGRVPSPWYHNPMKVAGAITLFIGSVTIAVNLRYRETVPFTGRTRLVVLSPQVAREIEEAEFEEFKNKNASDILEPDHPDTIWVRRIAHAVITAAHVAFALKQQAMAQTSMHHGGLNWMDGLNWEVIIIKDLPGSAKCFPGAGKIIVSTNLLKLAKTDAEIAVSIAHEVGHVIQRATSSTMYSNWWLKIIKQMPYLSLIMLPTLRRHETEADHIGMLLLAAAGYDPRIALLDCYMFAKMQGDLTTKWKSLESHLSIHPSDRKRLELLLQPDVVEEALDLYKQVTGIGQG